MGFDHMLGLNNFLQILEADQETPPPWGSVDYFFLETQYFRL